LHRELIDRNVDLLIARRYGPIADKLLEFELLFDDSYVVAVGAQSSWARRRKITLAKLLNEPWVLRPPESMAGSRVMEAFRASGLDYPRATVFTASPEVRMSLLATGRFISIFPESVLRFSARHSELKILPIKVSLSHVPVGIVT